MPSSPGKAPIHLDGTTLEGGGQLVRVALSLSALTHVPVHITKIRGKRDKKGQAGGLKAAHLAAAQWLAKACEAETQGLEIKSRELVFKPSRLTGIIYGDQTKVDESLAGLWKNVYEDGKNGKLIRRESEILLSSPGSIFLVFQAILPFILFSKPPSPSGSVATTSTTAAATAGAADYGTPVRITIQGGTNNTNSPSLEYIDQVLLPMLSSKVGIPPIDMKLEARGWTHGRPEVGRVRFDITPLRPGSVLPSFSFTNKGEITKIHVSILASPAATRDAIRNKVIARILTKQPDVEILFPVNEDTRDSRRLYLLVVAETSNGYRLGRDWLYDRKLTMTTKVSSSQATTTTTTTRKVVDELVSRVVNDLEKEIAHGGCVDEYLQDQLVVFQALAKGTTSINYGKGKNNNENDGKEELVSSSLHTKTVQWVAEEILGVKFLNNNTRNRNNNKNNSEEEEEEVAPAPAPAPAQAPAQAQAPSVGSSSSTCDEGCGYITGQNNWERSM